MQCHDVQTVQEREEWRGREEGEIWPNMNGRLDREHVGVRVTFSATLMKI